MAKHAWVTLATNDSYALGALVLAHSLRRVHSAHPAVVLITPSVSDNMRSRLSAVFAEVVTVDVLDSRDAAHLALLARPELGITFTKIHCWSLTQYDKCVFLDADTLVLQNSDELFEREELSAAPDVGWPDCFNSGVFVFRPSEATFNSLLEFAKERGSFDGGDQGLLNSYFSSWAHGDITKHLPFLYNVTSVAFYSYLPALKQYGQDVKIVHFIGNAKPWLQRFNWETRTVDAEGHVLPTLQLWWDLFVGQVHPQLDQTMTGLAGTLARLTLGSGPIQQAALDEHTRRQGWEAGNIDYLGADSFDNIWAKISATLAQTPSAPKPEESAPPTAVSPLATVSSPAKEVASAPGEVSSTQESTAALTSPSVTATPTTTSAVVPASDPSPVIPISKSTPTPTSEIVSAPAPSIESTPVPVSTTETVSAPASASETASDPATANKILPETAPVSEISPQPVPSSVTPQYTSETEPDPSPTSGTVPKPEIVSAPTSVTVPAAATMPGTESIILAEVSKSPSAAAADIEIHASASEPIKPDPVAEPISAKMVQQVLIKPEAEGTKISNPPTETVAIESTTEPAHISESVSEPPKHEVQSPSATLETITTPVETTVESPVIKSASAEVQGPQTPQTAIVSSLTQPTAESTPKKVIPEQTSTDSPPLISTPVKDTVSPKSEENKSQNAKDEEAPKTETRKGPPGEKLNCQLKPLVESMPLLTPDSELEDAATLAQKIIASELGVPLTPQVISATPPVLSTVPPLLKDNKQLSVEEPALPTPPVSLAQIGILPKAGTSEDDTASETPSNLTINKTVDDKKSVASEPKNEEKFETLSKSVKGNENPPEDKKVELKEDEQIKIASAQLEQLKDEAKQTEVSTPPTKKVEQSKEESKLVKESKPDKDTKDKKMSATLSSEKSTKPIKSTGKDSSLKESKSSETVLSENVDSSADPTKSVKESGESKKESAGETVPEAPRKKKLVKKVVKKEDSGDKSTSSSEPPSPAPGVIPAPVPPPRKKEKKPAEKK